MEGVTVEPTAEIAQLQLGFVDHTHWRYEVIRPLVLFADRTASQRAQEIETHPDTVRTLQRRFRQQGMRGLLPADVEVVHVGADGLDLLRESVDVLAASPALLERAKSLTELGAALRRANQRAEARPRLHDGLELADRCGAKPVAERAHAELLATGARPRRLVRTGIDSLTPSERRVAQMAADGQTNREIAQALFVTPKTIEMHLSKAYRKLDIQSRSQLARAMADR